MSNQSKTRQRINEKIEELKAELLEISAQIETERHENSEEDSAIRQELLDKKEIIEQQIVELQNSLRESFSENNNFGKEYNLTINGTKRSFTVVHPTEANPVEGLISADSPLAKALEGRKSGDDVRVETPAGPQVYKVM